MNQIFFRRWVKAWHAQFRRHVTAASPYEPQGAAWAAGASDIGRQRVNNEDSFICDTNRQLFCICDGMGGHRGGERASALALSTLIEQFDALHQTTPNLGESDWNAFMLRALRHTNAQVRNEGDENAEYIGMGTTAVIAILVKDRVFIANVGDSRGYLIRDNQAQLLTSDHSIAAQDVINRQLPWEEVRFHPRRNCLTAYLGMPKEVQPHFGCETLRPDDRVVLVSDGVWDELATCEIAEIVCAHPAPAAAVRALIAAANDAGGSDNSTAIVVGPGIKV